MLADGFVCALVFMLAVCPTVEAQGQTPERPGRRPAFQPRTPSQQQQQNRGSRTRQQAPRGGQQQGLPGGADTRRGDGRGGQAGLAPGARDAGARGGPQTRRRQGGGGVRTVTGSGGGDGIRVREAGNFDPVQSLPVKYEDVPAVGEAITLSGPMAARDFLDAISIATDWNILASKGVDAFQLQFWINEMSPRDALEILKFHGLYYKFDRETNFLYVMSREEYLSETYGAVVEEEFLVRHTDVADAESIITALLSPVGRMILDARTGKIYVYDTETNLEHMRKAMERLDVPMETRTIALKYIDAEEVAISLEDMLTEQGELRIDPRSNTIMVTDLPARQEKIAALVQKLDRQLESRLWTLNYADPFDIADMIADLVPEEMGTITVNEPLHQIIVKAIPERLTEIDEQIAMLDRKRPQVQIEAYLVSLNSTTSREFGIDWSYFETIGDSVVGLLRGAPTPNLTPPGSGTRLSVGQLPEALTVPRVTAGGAFAPAVGLDGNPIIGGFRGDNLSAVLNYLEAIGDATIHTHPRVTVQDGEEAIFENITRVPFVTASDFRPVATAGGGFGNQAINRIDFVDVGTILSVLPRITTERSIVLELSAEESTFVFRDIVGQGQLSTVPEKSQNRAETIVEVADGQTIVIGGLRSSNVRKSVDKIPFLGDLPIFGRLFRTTSKEHKHNDLMIFVTPTLVDERTHPEAEHLAQMDEELAIEARHDSKGAFGRAYANVTHRENELLVSIGQTGALHANGERRTLRSLKKIMASTGRKRGGLARVVIRRHPRAPQDVVMAVTEMAMEARLKIEFDDRFIPFVPDYREGEKAQE